MAETPALQIQVQIERIRAVLQALGWSIIASDTRSSDIVLTIARPKAATTPTAG